MNRDTHGLVKLVADAALGASVVAEGAGEVIQAAAVALRHGITTAEQAARSTPSSEWWPDSSSPPRRTPPT